MMRAGSGVGDGDLEQQLVVHAGDDPAVDASAAQRVVGFDDGAHHHVCGGALNG